MRATCSASAFTVSPVRPSGGVEQVSVFFASGVDGGEGCVGCDEALFARKEAAPHRVDTQEKVEECATQECETDRRCDYRRESLRRGEPVAIAQRPSGGGIFDAALRAVWFGNSQCQYGSGPDRVRGVVPPRRRASESPMIDTVGLGTLSRRGGGGGGTTRCRAQIWVRE